MFSLNLTSLALMMSLLDEILASACIYVNVNGGLFLLT